MSEPHYQVLYAVASSDWAPWLVVYPFYSPEPIGRDAEMYFDWRA